MNAIQEDASVEGVAADFLNVASYSYVSEIGC